MTEETVANDGRMGLLFAGVPVGDYRNANGDGGTRSAIAVAGRLELRRFLRESWYVQLLSMVDE